MRDDIAELLENTRFLSPDEISFLKRVHRSERKLTPAQIRKVYAMQVRAGLVEPPPKKPKGVWRGRPR